MDQYKRGLLRTIINKQFNDGVNKANLLKSMETFIDFHYPTAIKKIYFSPKVKAEVINELVLDIINTGGLKKWKQELAKTIPSVQSSLPKGKEEK